MRSLQDFTLWFGSTGSRESELWLIRINKSNKKERGEILGGDAGGVLDSHVMAGTLVTCLPVWSIEAFTLHIFRGSLFVVIIC